MTELVIHTRREDVEHDAMIDAFLHDGGFFRLDGRWHEILTMVPEPGGLAWVVRPARLVGAA